jgi:hypothetical protein
MCICSLFYPACKTQALYYNVICSLNDCRIFSKSSHKQHDFRENVIEQKKGGFNQSIKLVRNTYLSKIDLSAIPLQTYVGLRVK